MERYLNTITMLLSIFGGIVVRLLGGLDQLLDVFLFFNYCRFHHRLD